MVGLLGMMAAGGSMGARDASNASVRAQNELEIGSAREMMREEFLNRRFDRELDAARESSKAKAQQDEINYQRDLDAKKEQYAHELKKTGLLNQGRITAANIREGGANARHKERMELEKRGEKQSSSNEDLMVTLKDGRKYIPQTQQEKDARTLVLTGKAPDFETAIDIVTQRGLLSNASKDIRAFTSEKTVDTAGQMVNQLYGNKKQSGYEFTFDPKSKKLIPLGQ